jgi:hypothetical protein
MVRAIPLCHAADDMRHLAKTLATLVLTATVARAQAPANQICGTATTHPAVYEHVLWIWMEDHGTAEILRSPDAAYINTLITSCGLAKNYHAITHPALPNYLGAVTGLPLRELNKFGQPCDPGPTCSVPAASIFSQVHSWKAYMESMDVNCQVTGFTGYAVRHNPPTYLTSLTGCDQFDVPYSQLAVDLANDTLPEFAFITPNTVNDMHDGIGADAIRTGDAWLQSEVAKILASAAYRRGKTAVFVTFDEGDVGARGLVGQNCLNSKDEACIVPAIVIAPSVRPGKTSGRLFTHYSLLKTTEKMLGAKPLGMARRARNMRRPFNL